MLSQSVQVTAQAQEKFLSNLARLASIKCLKNYCITFQYTLAQNITGFKKYTT